MEANLITEIYVFCKQVHLNFLFWRSWVRFPPFFIMNSLFIIPIIMNSKTNVNKTEITYFSKIFQMGFHIGLYDKNIYVILQKYDTNRSFLEVSRILRYLQILTFYFSSDDYEIEKQDWWYIKINIFESYSHELLFGKSKVRILPTIPNYVLLYICIKSKTDMDQTKNLFAN